MTRSPWIWLLLAAAAILPFLPSLQGGFVFDDTGVILDNPAVWDPSPMAAARSSYWPAWPEAGLYRPVTTLSYWLTARVFGRSPWAFHAGNLLLNAAVACLLAGVLLRLFPKRRRTAFAASLIFALHPLHSEVVASIVGRAELWAAFWSLIAYILVLRPARNEAAQILISSAAVALAFLSKESAAGILALPLLHLIPWARPSNAIKRPASGPAGLKGAHVDRVRGQSFWLWTGAGWASALALLLLLRIRVLGSLFGLERVGMIENVLAYSDVWTRASSALGFQWILMQRLFLPLTLSADFSYPQLIPSPAWIAAGVLLLLLIISALAVAIRRRSWPWIWGIGWILGTGILTSNVVFPIGTVLAERLGYLPSAGFLWLVALCFARLLEAGGRALKAVLLAVVVIWASFLSVRSFQRSQDWRSDITLYKSAVAAAPRSAKMWANLCGAYLEAGYLEEGLEAGRRAVSLLPDYSTGARALASGLVRAGKPEEAHEVLSQAKDRGELDATYQLVQGNVLLALRRGEEAEESFRRAISLARTPDNRHVVGLASSLAMQQRWSESRETWRDAIRRDPSNPDYRRAWAYTIWQAGSPDSAEALYRELLLDTPKDALLLNDAAWFLSVSDRDLDEALRLAEQAFSLDPGRQTGDTWLEALVRARGCGRAHEWVDSLSIAGVDPSVVVDLIEGLESRCGPAGRHRDGTPQTTAPGER